MNSASVFKNQGFIDKNERVRIPDVELDENALEEELTLEAEEAAANAGEENKPIDQESTVQPELNSVEEPFEMAQDDEAPASEGEPAPEPVAEPEPQPQYPTQEELCKIYEQQLSELCANVAEHAYYDALNRKKAELRDTIEDVKALMDELAISQRRFIDEYTEELKYMAVDIAEKMILEKIEKDDTILERLVLQSIKNVKNADWLNVEISERLVNLVDKIKRELDKPEYSGRAHVIPVVGTDDICRVTTEDGTIVSTIEVQAKNLRAAFREAQQQ